jgi:microsomal dipeptidase-like Zn-dependent dipeptidase
MAPAAVARHAMVGVAAYYRAERRGFAPGGAEADWLEAEADIDRLLDAMTRQGISRADYDGVGLRNALRLWTTP